MWRQPLPVGASATHADEGGRDCEIRCELSRIEQRVRSCDASLSSVPLSRCLTGLPARAVRGYGRMFTARAVTSSTVSAESVDSAAISSLAGRVSGIASVGLNAVALVSDM